jgi:hypothetical protein
MQATMAFRTICFLSLSIMLASELVSGFTGPMTPFVRTAIGRHLLGRSTLTGLFYSNRDGNDKRRRRDGDFDMDTLRRRLDQLRVRDLEQGFQRPPNPNLTATEFIRSCLDGLLTNDEPLPDSGLRLLLRASTKSWRTQIHRSVGAPLSADEEMVVSALGEAIGRSSNQFAILVGEGEAYTANFPMEPLDYADETCWVECQLRSTMDDKLLVTTGWQLHKENGAWMVENIDWQDFREMFRPGIGREEWMRICG